MLGINQIFSPFLLLACVLGYYYSVQRKPMLSIYMLTYLGCIGLYLFLGLFASVYNGNERIGLSATIFSSYLTAIFIILSVYLHVKMLGPEYEQKLLNMIFVFLLIGASLIPFSDMINISGALVTTRGRGTGLFANPNEAGVMCVIGFAAALCCNINPMLKRIALVHLAIMATLTFSKTSMLLIVVILIAYLGLQRNIGKSMLYIFVTIGVVFSSIIAFQDDILSLFPTKQAARVGQVLSLVTMQGGYSDDELTSGRTELWDIGYRKISENPFWGNGLGELYSMKEARISVNKGMGQGVHNTYLLKAGDSGIFAVTAFIGFLIYFVLSCYRYRVESPAVKFSLLYMLVFATNAISSHAVEFLRFHNFFIGACLAFLAHAQIKAMQRSRTDSVKHADDQTNVAM